MADIRINALATTATSSASDDYIAIDGSANGTRKLSVFSPTFGGAVTVSNSITSTGSNAALFFNSRTGANSNYAWYSADGSTARLYDNTNAKTLLEVTANTGATTVLGNLTVAGTGTSSVAGLLTVQTSTARANITTDANLVTQNGIGIVDTGSTYGAGYQYLRLMNSAAGLAGSIAHTASTGIGIFSASDLSFGGNNAIQMTLNTSGNLLLGTTTDSSNGKLQLATHTASTGGIGFGTDNWLYRYNSTQLVIGNGTGGSGSAIASNMNLRIENAGNGGIQINVPDASTAGVYFGRAADGYYTAIERSGTNLQLRNNGTTALTLDSSQRIIVYNATGRGSRFTMPNNSAISWNNAANTADDVGIYADNSNALNLRTANANTLVLDSSQNATFAGKVTVGTSTLPAYGKMNVLQGIQVTGAGEGGFIQSRDGTNQNAYLSLGASYDSATSYDIALAINNIAAAASKQIKIVNRTNGVTLTDGATSWAALSDERQKDIIEPIVNAATKVSSLRAVIGKLKNDSEGKRRSMLIAQDVQKVLPEAVNVQTDEQGTLLLSYTDVIPLLVASIKELTNRIATLESK